MFDQQYTGQSPEIRDPKIELVEKLKNDLDDCAAGNLQQLFGAHEALRKLIEHVDRGPHKSLVAVCRATHDLLSHLLRRGSVGEKDAIDVASSMVAFVEASFAEPVPGIADSPVQQDSGAGSASTQVQLASTGRSPSSRHRLGNGAPLSFDRINETRLGEILVKMGKIDREALEKGLVMQKLSRKRLGEVLVAMDVLKPSDLEEAFEWQRHETLRLADGLSAGDADRSGPPTLGQ